MHYPCEYAMMYGAPTASRLAFGVPCEVPGRWLGVTFEFDSVTV